MKAITQILSLFLVGSSFAITPSPANPVGFELLDTRIEAVKQGPSPASKDVLYFGKTAVIRGSNIVSSSGRVLFHASEPLLDAVWRDGHEYILSRTELNISKPGAKNKIKVKLPASSDVGSLLITKPSFVLFLAKSQASGFIISLTSRTLKIVDHEENMAGAAVDHSGNLLIASDNDVFAISHAGHRVPLLHIQDAKITSLAILDDDSLILSTSKGLLKYGRNHHVYRLLQGVGTLEKRSLGFVWCDQSSGGMYLLQHLELPGTAASDLAYVRTLLKEARLYVGLKQTAAAYKKVSRILEITPNDQEVLKLADLLRKMLLSPKNELS